MDFLLQKALFKSQSCAKCGMRLLESCLWWCSSGLYASLDYLMGFEVFYCCSGVSGVGVFKVQLHF